VAGVIAAAWAAAGSQFGDLSSAPAPVFWLELADRAVVGRAA